MSYFPKIKSASFNYPTLMSLPRSQDNTCFQNSQDSLQEKSGCSMDSSSFSQKVHSGDCVIPKRNSFSFGPLYSLWSVVSPLVSWYWSVIAWLCSRTIWLQWRPLLPAESPVAQRLQHPTRYRSRKVVGSNPSLCFFMYLPLIYYWRPSEKKLKLQNTACTKEYGIHPRFGC